MKTLTLYTNLHSDAETLIDVRRRGKAVRFHPDPERARTDSSDGDLIVELGIRLPDGAAFLIYRETERGAVIYAQDEDFGEAYAAAVRQTREGDKSVITAVITGRNGSERLLVPLSDFVTTMEFHLEDLAA